MKNLSKKELIEKAKSLGLKNYSKLTKPELISLIGKTEKKAAKTKVEKTTKSKAKKVEEVKSESKPVEAKNVESAEAPKVDKKGKLSVKKRDSQYISEGYTDKVDYSFL